jgi:hypothetical protein
MKTNNSRLNLSLVATIIASVTLLAQSVTAQQWTINSLPPGLIAWWAAEGNLLDSGGVHHGGGSAAPTYAPGRFGQAFQFNGSDQSVSIPDIHADLDNWTQFSLEAWVNLDLTADVPGPAPGRMIFSKVGNAADQVNYNQGYQFGPGYNATKIFLAFNTNGQAWPGCVTVADLGVPLATNTWYHLVGTYDHNAAKIYLNGVPLVTNVIGPVTLQNSGSSLRISKDDNLNAPFAGRIDDARIYNRALSAAEVACLVGEPQGRADFSDDFNSGVNSNVWAVGSTDPLYSLDASHGDIRFSRLAGGTYSAQTMALAFDREVHGDFDASVDFRDASIDRLDGSPGNQVQLVASFGGQAIIVVRSDESGHGHNAHVFRNPPAAWTGEMATTATSGTFRITRAGEIVTAYYNGAVLHSGSYNTAPLTSLYFHLQNNGTRDAISVAFDNFHLQADRIVPKAARLQTLGTTGNPFLLRLLNPTPGAWHWIEHTPVLPAANGWSVRGRIVGGALPVDWNDTLPPGSSAGFYRVRSQ